MVFKRKLDISYLLPEDSGVHLSLEVKDCYRMGTTLTDIMNTLESTNKDQKLVSHSLWKNGIVLYGRFEKCKVMPTDSLFPRCGIRGDTFVSFERIGMLISSRHLENEWAAHNIYLVTFQPLKEPHLKPMVNLADVLRKYIL